ncbi:MAG: hypothetical protein IT393_02510 [Nitrospirae bacterium]|nr:hypothetical protein [Nitrospirota bacterium]
MQNMAGISGLRQLYHSLAGLTLVFVVSYLPEPADVYLVLILLFLAAAIESSRLFLPEINRMFIHFFGIMMRSEERHGPTGSLYYLLGAMIALLLFPKEIALFSMTVLAVGDPSAYIIGYNFGRLRIGKKSLEGSLAFLTAAVIAGLFLHVLWDKLSVYAIITGAVTGAVIELIPVRINDNLTIPVAASATTYFMFLYFN